jgi:hypothetical protein
LTCMNGPYQFTTGTCASTALKFYSGSPTNKGTTAVTAGSCTYADGNNLGLCVSGGVTAGNTGTVNSGSAYDFNAGTLTALTTT